MGRPVHCRSLSAASCHQAQGGVTGVVCVWGVCKGGFCWACSPGPGPLHLVGSSLRQYFKGREQTFRQGESRERLWLRGKHVQDLGAPRRGLFGCWWGRAWNTPGEGPAGGCASPGRPTGPRFPAKFRLQWACEQPCMPETTLSPPWRFPPGLESTPGLKLISLPLHNSCAASPKHILSLIAQNALCYVVLGPGAPGPGWFTQLEPHTLPPPHLSAHC